MASGWNREYETSRIENKTEQRRDTINKYLLS